MTATFSSSSSSTWSSANASCPPGGVVMERVRYFPRQLIGADDLTQDQRYNRAKHQRHNRTLHGWGVVCGAEVLPSTGDWTVCVSAGYALSPQGDEILIDCPVKVDLSSQDLDGNATLCGQDADPWCASVRTDRQAGQKVYLAVAYAEFLARPVKVHPAGCICDGDCEYSRVREGYTFKVLDTLPSSYANLDPVNFPFACPANGVRDCPPCPPEPWVILAEITLNQKTVAKADIDNATYRRYVASFADWWFRCGQASASVEIRQLVDFVNQTPQPDLATDWKISESGAIAMKLQSGVELATGAAMDSSAALKAFADHLGDLQAAGYQDATAPDALTIDVRAKPGLANQVLQAISKIKFTVKAK